MFLQENKVKYSILNTNILGSQVKMHSVSKYVIVIKSMKIEFISELVSTLKKCPVLLWLFSTEQYVDYYSFLCFNPIF